MTDHPAAPLLAADLGRLPRTNARGEKGTIHIPGFLSTTGTSPEQAEETGLLGLAVAEGIIEDLAKHGYEVIHKSELAERVKAASVDKPAPSAITLYCNRCQRAVLKVDVSGPAPKLHLSTAIAGLQAHMEQCR